jgi:WS/DGAT C-terminal domain
MVVADLGHGQVDLLGRKARVVMSNVVVLAEVLHLAGVPIDRSLPWAPHHGRQLGMAVSILSYRGMALLSEICDAHLVPDSEVITAEFNREFQKMQKSAAAGASRAITLCARAKKTPARKTPAS